MIDIVYIVTDSSDPANLTVKAFSDGQAAALYGAAGPNRKWHQAFVNTCLSYKEPEFNKGTQDWNEQLADFKRNND